MNDTPLWTPSPERVAGTQVMDFMRQVNARHGLGLKSYKELHAWSVAHPDLFWDQIWDYCGVIGDKGARQLIDGDKMPGAKFFPDAQINFAENLLRKNGAGDAHGVPRRGQGVLSLVLGRPARLRLARAAGAAAAGIGKGDRVAAMLPNLPESVGADAGGDLARRDLVVLLAGFRRTRRARPLRPDRAQGVHRGRRLLV